MPEQPEIIKRFFSTAFPNPERIGCPDKTVLRAIAANTLPLDHPAFPHLASCSPCYIEVEELAKQLRTERRRKPYQFIAAGVASLAIGAAVLWIVYHHDRITDQASISKTTKPSAPGVQPPGTKQGSPTPAKTPINVALDLRSITPTRNAGDVKNIPAFPVPAALVNMQITLPLGSDDGSYEVQIQGSENRELLKSATGRAEIINGDTRLEITLDLMGIAPGNYAMLYRHVDASWRRVPLSITR